MKKFVTLLSLATAVLLSAPAALSDDKETGDKGKTMQLTGCLSEREGSFLLTNKEYPDGIRLATTENLKEHVGHKVQVSGTMSTLPSAGSEKRNEINVSSFKHISKTCDTASSPSSSKY